VTQALAAAGGVHPANCFFVDDNRANVDAACKLGFGRSVHYCERGLEMMEGGVIKQIDGERLDGVTDDEVRDLKVIGHLDELRVLWPDIFKSGSLR
jgi:pyrimidine and pyridine-specific 5'-nucleotidase